MGAPMARAMAIAVATGSWLVGPSAHADDDVAACTTRSDRSPGEIVTPTSVYMDRPMGVTIVDGETLCLTGKLLGGTTDLDSRRLLTRVRTGQ